MTDALLLGLGKFMIPIPPTLWRRRVKARARKIHDRLGFMSENHHKVRDFVVTELARGGKPVSPESIAEALGLATPLVTSILAELEEHLTFVVRNDRGAVTWAYPVTVEATPHHARFRSGEEAYSP